MMTASNTACVMESMESRTMLSASTAWFDQALSPTTSAPTVSASLQRSYAPAIATKTAVKYISVVGQWTGTTKTEISKAVASISMKITTQKNGAATGTFSMGPISRGASILSTATVGQDKSFRGVLKGSNYYGSFTATISANGKMIFGRWCCNTAGKWETGTFTLNKA